MTFEPQIFAEKYQLAVAEALRNHPSGGVCGFEVEWNLLDQDFRPLLTVGTGPGQQSFVDYLRACCVPDGIRDQSQLEVFHWMIEWATRPFYDPRGAVFEARLMEAVLINALNRVGRQHGQRLYCWHGNLMYPASIGRHAIPTSWHLAKRRYLEHCVDLYGDSLATAGLHTNLSLPEPLVAWDYMHQDPGIRGNGQLGAFKNQIYITGTRLMRAFAALFIATTASTPLQATERDGAPVVVLTGQDSLRSQTFPNPENLDVPDLYRSYEDYLHISYDLVRRGVRFGNNNWTPVRARSLAEPVEHVIQVTSDQLSQLYARGLYVVGQTASTETMAAQIEVENLLARINIPMARVEVRTDDGGHPLEVDIANLVLKMALLLRFYADPTFGRAFRYDREDIDRVRRNEAHAAHRGLAAQIEDPLTGKPVGMRAFLRWTLDQIEPLARALNWADYLEPLRAMAAGEPNTAERLRQRIRELVGDAEEIPTEVLRQLAEERQIQVKQEMETIVAGLGVLGAEAAKLGASLQHARDDVRNDLHAPIRFQPRSHPLVEVTYTDITTEILDLSSQLMRIPSISVGSTERLDEIHRASMFIGDYLRLRGLEVRVFDERGFPALLAGFPGGLQAPVMLCGHFDVVSPEPDDRQFEARVEGDFLCGRGAADMKTVVATFLVWLKDTLAQGPPYPPVNLLLVGNEERGEGEPMGTPFVLRELAGESGYAPELIIAGERTGERGDEVWGRICTQNRGVMRFQVVGRGARGHSATTTTSEDLNERLFEAQIGLRDLMHQYLTLDQQAAWRSQYRFPFIQAGIPGVYNITADEGILGVEVRPIPQDDVAGLQRAVEVFCRQNQLEIRELVVEPGIACDSNHPALLALIDSVRTASGHEPELGRKLAGTSARFSPRGQGIVWGQTGVGPHSRDERHFIPSIAPYYRALGVYGRRLLTPPSGADADA